MAPRPEAGRGCDGRANGPAAVVPRHDEPARSWLARLGMGPAERPVPARGIWVGASGRRYLHLACPIATVPDVGPATFLLVEHLPTGRVRVHYAGQADDLRRALAEDRDGARDEAVRRGARHVHVCLAALAEADRRAIVADLVRRLRPPLNAAPETETAAPRPGLVPGRLVAP